VKFICICSTRFENYGSYYENKFKLTMPKRICPFDYDFVPQSKLHISEKELYDEESVKSVYGKTCYFYIPTDIGSSLWYHLDVLPYLVTMMAIAYLRKAGSSCNHFLMVGGVHVNFCPQKKSISYRIFSN
jgi:hypothetical protein